MAVAKKQTAAKPRTRTATTAATTSSASKSTAKRASAPKTPSTSSSTDTADTANAIDKTNATDTTDKTKAEAEKPVQSSQKTDKNANQMSDKKTVEPGNRISVTIPLDSAAVGLAVKAATLPVTAVKKVAQNKNGIPAYVAVGGLAVIGAVEWPVAAVGGLSLAALRRWGPLKPAREQESAKQA